MLCSTFSDILLFKKVLTLKKKKNNESIFRLVRHFKNYITTCYTKKLNSTNNTLKN